ncbi:cupin domain-containing protein [uncultured Bacteroides sp.]|uniref:cupin domain-containing protein n=1 Tax=uncultured Bacteroides sp. TaxID=162156 RepID=UPI002AAAC0E5|nr:cupin domain-containing protein [uncultured Bacteroides sp.]
MYAKITKEEASHYFWGNQCESRVLLGKEELSVKLESMPAATREENHYHIKAQQFFFMLKGEAVFHFETASVTVSEKEGISIDPRTHHYIANESTEEIEFPVISQPETQNDRYKI